MQTAPPRKPVTRIAPRTEVCADGVDQSADDGGDANQWPRAVGEAGCRELGMGGGFGKQHGCGDPEQGEHRKQAENAACPEAGRPGLKW